MGEANTLETTLNPKILNIKISVFLSNFIFLVSLKFSLLTK